MQRPGISTKDAIAAIKEGLPGCYTAEPEGTHQIALEAFQQYAREIMAAAKFRGFALIVHWNRDSPDFIDKITLQIPFRK